MFICNIKLNGTRLFKIFFAFLLIIVLSIFVLGIYQLVHKANSSFSTNDQIEKSDVKTIDANNYTNILKASHEHIDEYVGNRIRFIGYVYRVSNFTENQFVLARDMIISSDFQSVIVGFLCESREAKKFSDGSWIEITGEITKGNYNGEMPIVKVEKIQECQKPNDEYVYPPDETYIPTSTIF